MSVTGTHGCFRFFLSHPLLHCSTMRGITWGFLAIPLPRFTLRTKDTGLPWRSRFLTVVRPPTGLHFSGLGDITPFTSVHYRPTDKGTLGRFLMLQAPSMC